MWLGRDAKALAELQDYFRRTCNETEASCGCFTVSRYKATNARVTKKQLHQTATVPTSEMKSPLKPLLRV